MMAKGEMNDFLNTYFRRLHTDAMDYDVLARLVDNKKKGLLTKEQEEWFDPNKGFLEPDSNSPLGYKAKAVPELNNTDDLHEDELRKLYEAFARAMAGMKSASADYGAKDSAAKDFVKRWVDEVQLFSTPKATQECDQSITNLINLLDETGKTDEERETIKNIKQVIFEETKKDYTSDDKLFGQPADLEKLLGKCKDKKYNSDTSVQNKIQKVARTLDNYLNSYSWSDETVSNTKQKNKAYLAPLSDDLSIIHREDAFSNIEITDENLTKFKDIYGQQILDTLYYNKDVREKFREHDIKKITERIDKAEKKVNYQDPNSDNYVKPKKDDTLTPLQQVEKWATDTYNNSIRKYARLRGDPLLFSPFSKEIFKAIDKEKVKPTDGIDGILAKADAIKKRIPNKTITDHFDWFVETMNQIKADKPKAFAGAWNNARQMKTVITEIMLKATGPNAKDSDMEKAKTAMEIMTAMKYGMMTSKVMDAMKQTEFSIFSDGQLSWNKNEGIQFVTKAFDKSVKAAFLGVGYAVTFARNKIMMSGMKYNKKNNKEKALAGRIAWENNRLALKRNKDERAIQDTIANERQKIDNNTTIKNNLDTSDGINDHTIHQKEQDVANKKNNLEAKKQELDNHFARREQYRQAHENYEANKKIIDEYNQLPQKIAQLTTDQTSKKNEIVALRQQILNPNTYIDSLTGLQMGDEEKKAQEAQLIEQLKQLQTQYDKTTNELTECQNKRTPAYYNSSVVPARDNMTRLQNNENNYNNAAQDYNTTKQQYDSMETDYNELNDKVQQFNDATKAIDESNETIDKQNKALANWSTENINKIKQLEDFWNFLQTGKTKTWRLRTDKAQEKLDANKKLWLEKHVRNHGMAI